MSNERSHTEEYILCDSTDIKFKTNLVVKQGSGSLKGESIIGKGRWGPLCGCFHVLSLDLMLLQECAYS